MKIPVLFSTIPAMSASVVIEGVGDLDDANVVLRLRVSNGQLYSWYKQLKIKEATVLELLNDSVDVIRVAESACRLLERVRVKAYTIASDIKKSDYRKQKSIESRSSVFLVYRDELVRIRELEDTINTLTEDILEHK